MVDIRRQLVGRQRMSRDRLHVLLGVVVGVALLRYWLSATGASITRSSVASQPMDAAGIDPNAAIGSNDVRYMTYQAPPQGWVVQ